MAATCCGDHPEQRTRAACSTGWLLGISAAAEGALYCRIADVAGAHLYARTGIPTHGRSTLLALAVQFFSIVLVGNQIAEYALAGGDELLPVEGYRSANSGAVCLDAWSAWPAVTTGAG
jgi:hypothetical protein